MQRFVLVLALVLVLGRTTDGQDYMPLGEADSIPLAPSLLDRGRGLFERVGRLSKGLVPPATGEHEVAVLLVELADCPRPKFEADAWQAALFSRGEYRRTPDGVPAFGSVRDYYLEQSAGKLDVTGRVFPWVKVAARRADLEGAFWFGPGAKRPVLDAAVDALLAREGARALDRFDSLAFVVSGGWAKKRGSVLWPHSNVLRHRGRTWRYYLMHAGEQGFEPIGVHAHELGHVLGLPDEYGLGRRAGSGIWCAMASGAHGANAAWLPVDAPVVAPLEQLRLEARKQLEELFRGPGCPAPLDRGGPARPLHLCACCKAALGWVKPIAVDPSKRQRLFLEPVEDRHQVLALPLGGGQRLLLEYRAPRGFDSGLPRSGLLAWRSGDLSSALRTTALATNGELVAAHGVRSVDAAYRGPDAVMFPWRDRDSFSVSACGRTVRVSGIKEEQGRLLLEVGGE